MRTVLIAYSTQYGQTEKIAKAIKHELAALGIEGDLLLVEGEQDQPPSILYDAVVVGGPVYIGKIMPLLTGWALRHHGELNAVPSALFSVSLNAADKRPEARKEDARILDEFVQTSGLQPSVRTSLIGGVAYPRYGFFKRLLMRKICREAGGPTDIRREHELTDWEAVRAFAREVAALMKVPAAVG